MRNMLGLAVLLSSATVTEVYAQDDPVVSIEWIRREEGEEESRALFHRWLQRSMAAIRACQERQIAQGIRARGRVDYRVVGAPDAPHVEVTRRTFRAELALEACMLRVMQRIRVPSSSTLRVRLALWAPPDPTAQPTPSAPTDVELARAEVEALRTESRCLARAAARITRLLEAWDGASPRRRERLAAQMTEARGAVVMCRGLLGLLGAGRACTMTEMCGNQVDDDCNGHVDDGCQIHGIGLRAYGDGRANTPEPGSSN
jgi:hypothetical protein